jgi:Mrp family chromosome partitioning ATPase
VSRLYEALEKARREGGGSTAEAGPRQIPMAPTGGPHFVDAGIITPRMEGCLQELMREDEPWIEQVRTLATRLRAMEDSESVRRIGMMSAIGGEGKTTLAAMMSLILAEDRGERVLLVDADLRHREVESVLGIKPASGLGDWLKQPGPQVSVRRLGAEGPFVLGAGRPFSKPWELVSSPHLATLLDAAAREFRYVITDCPAEGPVADAARIQEHMDALLLVVRARSAPRDAILSTLEHLQEEKILGVLFNGEVQARGRAKRYRYSHYKDSYKKRGGSGGENRGGRG